MSTRYYTDILDDQFPKMMYIFSVHSAHGDFMVTVYHSGTGAESTPDRDQDREFCASMTGQNIAGPKASTSRQREVNTVTVPAGEPFSNCINKRVSRVYPVNVVQATTQRGALESKKSTDVVRRPAPVHEMSHATASSPAIRPIGAVVLQTDTNLSSERFTT